MGNSGSDDPWPLTQDHGSLKSGRASAQGVVSARARMVSTLGTTCDHPLTAEIHSGVLARATAPKSMDLLAHRPEPKAPPAVTASRTKDDTDCILYSAPKGREIVQAVSSVFQHPAVPTAGNNNHRTW